MTSRMLFCFTHSGTTWNERLEVKSTLSSVSFRSHLEGDAGAGWQDAQRCAEHGIARLQVSTGAVVGHGHRHLIYSVLTPKNACCITRFIIRHLSDDKYFIIGIRIGRRRMLKSVHRCWWRHVFQQPWYSEPDRVDHGPNTFCKPPITISGDAEAAVGQNCY